MSDPDAEITIEALGKQYTIRYGNRAFRVIERELKKPLVRLNEESLDEMTTVIWAGLQTHQRDISIDEVDDIVDEIGYTKLGEIVQAALRKALPEQAGQASPNPNRATRRAALNGTGRGS